MIKTHRRFKVDKLIRDKFPNVLYLNNHEQYPEVS